LVSTFAAYRTGLLIAGAVIGDDADGFMVRRNDTGGLRAVNWQTKTVAAKAAHKRQDFMESPPKAATMPLW